MKEVTVTELKQMMDNGDDFQLIDIREEYEYEISNIGGELIPMAKFMAEAENISRDKKVIIHCRSGSRSAAVIKQLEATRGFENLYNLKGGLIAWADQVDHSVPKY